MLLRCTALVISLALAGSAAVAGPDEYRERRAKLRKSIGDNIAILFGAVESTDLRVAFFQESNFFYLTGWTEPGAVLVLTPQSEVLLLPSRNPGRERYNGQRSASGDPGIAAATGFESVLPAESFEANLLKWAETGAAVYTFLKTPGASAIERMLPLREVRNLSPLMAKLRMTKSEAELVLMKRATDATIDAHLAAWKIARSGIPEYQVAAAMSAVYFGRGCERHAYPPIVGAGPNGLILHYVKKTRKIDDGELVLMDVGAECDMYASDITRTIPANGKFNARQRELYDIVLGAQSAAIAAVKPGVLLKDLTLVALEYLNAHGKDRNGNSLGQYFTHGIGHHVGLDVHDLSDSATPLAAGMVITIEPGLYIPDEGIGIRIEDMVEVTADGARVLSSRLPREAAAIEKAMGR